MEKITPVRTEINIDNLRGNEDVLEVLREFNDIWENFIDNDKQGFGITAIQRVKNLKRILKELESE